MCSATCGPGESQGVCVCVCVCVCERGRAHWLVCRPGVCHGGTSATGRMDFIILLPGGGFPLPGVIGTIPVASEMPQPGHEEIPGVCSSPHLQVVHTLVASQRVQRFPWAPTVAEVDRTLGHGLSLMAKRTDCASSACVCVCVCVCECWGEGRGGDSAGLLYKNS